MKCKSKMLKLVRVQKKEFYQCLWFTNTQEYFVSGWEHLKIWTFLSSYLGKVMISNFRFWHLKVGFSVFVQCLLQYHGASIYPNTLCIEEAKTNVFVKYECTTKLTFRKNEKSSGYMRCFGKLQISVFNLTMSLFWQKYGHSLQVFCKNYIKKTRQTQGPQAIFNFFILTGA